MKSAVGSLYVPLKRPTACWVVLEVMTSLYHQRRPSQHGQRLTCHRHPAWSFLTLQHDVADMIAVCVLTSLYHTASVDVRKCSQEQSFLCFECSRVLITIVAQNSWQSLFVSCTLEYLSVNLSFWVVIQNFVHMCVLTQMCSVIHLEPLLWASCLQSVLLSTESSLFLLCVQNGCFGYY